jgi:hypothetical protein
MADLMKMTDSMKINDLKTIVTLRQNDKMKGENQEWQKQKKKRK